MKYMKPWPLFREAIKNSSDNGGKAKRLLGLDVGDKYVGLAISDPSSTIANPLRVLVKKSATPNVLINHLQNLVNELSVKGFVVGAPWLASSHTPDAWVVKGFVEELCSSGNFDDIKFTYWEESFTSKNVEMMIEPLKLSPGTAKTIVDKFAAVGILQGYLDYVNKKVRMETD